MEMVIVDQDRWAWFNLDRSNRLPIGHSSNRLTDLDIDQTGTDKVDTRQI